MNFKINLLIISSKIGSSHKGGWKKHTKNLIQIMNIYHRREELQLGGCSTRKMKSGSEKFEAKWN
jgi:hypothetical protein